MTMERAPQGDDSLYELAYRAEAALVAEGSKFPKYYSADGTLAGSEQLCDQLRSQFELKYHLVGDPTIDQSPIRPNHINPIYLTNPPVFLPANEPGERSLAFNIKGYVPVFYSIIMLFRSANVFSEIYHGPHFVGRIDTSILNKKSTDYYNIPRRMAGFAIPFKDTVVADKYRPTLYN